MAQKPYSISYIHSILYIRPELREDWKAFIGPYTKQASDKKKEIAKERYLALKNLKKQYTDSLKELKKDYYQKRSDMFDQFLTEHDAKPKPLNKSI